MIFNVNELGILYKKKKRRKKLPISPTKSPFPRLAITQKTRATKNRPPIFEIVDSKSGRRKKIAKIVANNYKLNNSSSKILLALLYWANGAKYPSSNFVSFSNSDYVLVRTFLRLLRRTFKIDEKKFRVHLQLNIQHNKKEIIKFWSGCLGIPKQQFYDPTILKSPKKSRFKNNYGICAVRYYNLDLLLTIMQIYAEIAEII